MRDRSRGDPGGGAIVTPVTMGGGITVTWMGLSGTTSIVRGCGGVEGHSWPLVVTKRVSSSLSTDLTTAGDIWWMGATTGGSLRRRSASPRGATSCIRPIAS